MSNNYYDQGEAPNLVDGDRDHQRILDEAEPSDPVASTDQLPTTDTDLLFQYLANRDKMVSEGKETFYPQLGTIQESEDDRESDKHRTTPPQTEHREEHREEDLDDYVDERPDPRVFEQRRAETDHRDAAPEDPYAGLTAEQKKLMKLDMLRKRGELKRYGVTLSQNYNMDSDLNTMRYEYELHRSIRAKQNWVKWSSNVLLTCVHGLEMMNGGKYNPFKLRLKGWSQVMNAEITSYYDVFGDLYEKYNQPGEGMAPEVKLIMMIGGSAMKFHLMNLMMNKEIIEDRGGANIATDELREQAVRDRIIQQHQQEHDALNQTMQQQHGAVAQNARDLEMLRHQEAEHLRHQKATEIETKMREIDMLQEQLEQISQLSASPSQPMMRPPTRYQPAPDQVLNQMTSAERQELLRQQQILNGKEQMRQQELRRRMTPPTTTAADDDEWHFEPQLTTDQRLKRVLSGNQNTPPAMEMADPQSNSAELGDIIGNVDDILSRSQHADDSDSLLDESQVSSMSNGSRPRVRRRRRKKPALKITTSN